MALVASTMDRRSATYLRHIGLAEVLVVGRPVPVDLVQDPLHRRCRNRVHDVHERAWLLRPYLLDDLLGQPVELVEYGPRSACRS